MTEIDQEVEKDPATGEANKPLVDWENPPKLRDLKQDLQDATPNHNTQVQKIDTWLENLNVTGKAVVKTPEGNSSVVPKLIRKQAEWRYAALSEPYLSTDDVFKVSPVTWEDRNAAMQNQILLNNQFNTKIDKVAFIDEYVRTAVDEGVVVIKTGWEAEEVEYIEQVNEVTMIPDPEYQEQLMALQQLQQESPSEFATNVSDEDKAALQMSLETNVPYRPNITGQKEVKKTRLRKNQPTVEICNYKNVIIDPTAKGNVKNASFIIHRYSTSLSILEKDGRYKNLDKINPAGNSSPLNEPDADIENEAKGFQFNDKPRQKLLVNEYWGYWDIHKTGKVVPIVAAWIGDVMIRLEENPFPDGELPFIIVHYLPVRRSNYGEPDGVLIEDNQKIAGAVTRGMIDIMAKSANGQTGIRKDMLDATNRMKFNKGQDYEFNGGIDPSQGVYMHKYPEIPQSAGMMLQLQNMEAESLTGVKSFSQGVSGNALGEVAAGVRGALDAASKRELGILRRLSSGLVQIGRKFIAMNAIFLSDEEVIRVTNEEFVQIRKDDLAGSFDLKLGVSTAEEDEKKAQELAFMLQTMGNNMDPGMTKMILSDIARLRKMPDLAKKIEKYDPQPDPMAIKKAELELALLEAQIATEQAKAQAALATAGLSAQKVDTEAAKATHLRADTDNKNLEFVERESGVTQERELQKQGAQAAAQGQLKILEHHLDKKLEKK